MITIKVTETDEDRLEKATRLIVLSGWGEIPPGDKNTYRISGYVLDILRKNNINFKILEPGYLRGKEHESRKHLEYRIYRQFTGEIWKNPKTGEDFSRYLTKGGIKNKVKSNTIKGQLGELELKVSFGPAWFEKTEMWGEVKTKITNLKTQRKASEILVLLAEYIPKSKNNLYY